MKTTFNTLTVLCAAMATFTFSNSVFATVDSTVFNYQAVLRDANGDILANQDVALRITLLETAQAVYVETHSVTTNSYGLISIVIGQGIAQPPTTFQSLDWNSTNRFIQVEVDPAGGTNFQIQNVSTLLLKPEVNDPKETSFKPLSNHYVMSDEYGNSNLVERVSLFVESGLELTDSGTVEIKSIVDSVGSDYCEHFYNNWTVVNGEYFIQTYANPPGDYHQASKCCLSKSTHLCSYEEWSFACELNRDRHIKLREMNENWEWVGELRGSGSVSTLEAIAVGNPTSDEPDCLENNSMPVTTIQPFRCCARLYRRR